MMWQPIETAPKDGSFILLATPKGRIADGFWSPVYGVWSWPYVMVEPTHWMPLHELPGAQTAPSVPDGWKEAAIAWEVCASIHREYGKGKDPFFNTRQGDFVKHANDARAMLAAAPETKP